MTLRDRELEAKAIVRTEAVDSSLITFETNVHNLLFVA